MFIINHLSTHFKILLSVQLKLYLKTPVQNGCNSQKTSADCGFGYPEKKRALKASEKKAKESKEILNTARGGT